MSEETGGMMFREGQGIAILPREEGDIREYVRALEERIMRLEARLARSEADDTWTAMKTGGYQRGGPGGTTEEIDAKACAEGTCANCGHVGLGYEPWMRRNPRAYRAFTVCGSCGHREEF